MSFIWRFLKKYSFKSIPRFLIVIFIFAIWIRFLGVYPGFPANHPDEPTIYGSVSRIILHADFKPVLYSYGELLPELYAIFVFLFFMPIVLLKSIVLNFGQIFDQGLFPFFDNFRHSELLTGQNFLYWSRYLTSILGAVTVIVIYKLGTKLFNKWTGLLAAFFVAINYRHVLGSMFALADVPAGFFAALSVLVSFNLIKNRSRSSYLWAGLGLAMALSVKYFTYVIPTFFLCHIFAVFQENKLPFFKKIELLFLNKNLIISLFFCVGLFFTINPYIAFDFNTFIREYRYDAERFGVTSPIQQLLNYNYHKSLLPLYYLVRYSLGEPLIIAIISGFLYGLIRKLKSTLILSSSILPFLMIFIIIAAPSSPRYYASIVPLLLLFPAFMIVDLSQIITNRKLRFLLIIFLTLVVGSGSLKDSYLTSLYFSSEQNQVSSLTWLEKNLPNDSLVAVSAANLPLRKNIKEVDINPQILSMQELKENKVKWIVISSHYTSLANSQFWLSSQLLESTFFNDNLFWELINNTYTSLVLKEIGAYRIKEFLKPFWQSPDRAVFVAKMPEFWQIQKNNLIINYDFKSAEEIGKFKEVSLIPLKSNEISLSSEFGYLDAASLLIDVKECGLETNVSSEYFPVEANKWYSLEGFVNRQNSTVYKNQRDGFLRLDFYSDKNKRIKTYVSRLSDSSEDWQKLSAAGFAPALAKYVRIGFQLDKCFISEKYFVDHLQVFSSNNIPQMSKNDHPFYDKELPKNFLWLPEL